MLPGLGVSVRAPEYRPVRVGLSVKLAGGSNPVDARAALQAFLVELLLPWNGGGRGTSRFGRTLGLSQVEQALMGAEDPVTGTRLVERIERLGFRGDDEGRVALHPAPGVLLTSAESHEVEVST